MKFSVLFLTIPLLLFGITGCSKNSSTEVKTPGYVVTDFIKAKTWEERKQLIYDSDGLTEEMISRYLLNDQIKIQEIRRMKNIGEGIDFYTLSYSMPNSPTNSYQHYLVRKKNNKETIDWKAMIGYNSVDFNNYLVDPLPAPIKVRCYIEKYYLDFLGENINMSTIENHGFPVKLVPKKNKEYQRLKDLVDQGKTQIMVQITKWKCFPHLLSGLTVVEDCKVISTDWIER